MEKVFEKGIQLLRLANDEYLVIAQYPIKITGRYDDVRYSTDKPMIDESIFAEGFIEPTIAAPKEGVRYKGYVCVVRSAKSPILCQTFRFLCKNLGEALSVMRELSDKIPDLIENRCIKEAMQTGSYACQRDGLDEFDERCPYQYKDCPLNL